MPYAEVIGYPISHSKSPIIHKFWLSKCGIDGDYRSCHVRPDDLADYIAHRRDDADWRGCNVTIPHKIAVMDLVDDPGEVRGSIGAMNTVLRDPQSRLTGTNTDAAGFYAPLAAVDLQGAPVAIVGTGGAARAVLFALGKVDVGDVCIIARSPLKGAALLAQFGLKGKVQGFDAVLAPAALLVNASSLGMVSQPEYVPDLSPLPDDAIVYDLVYAPLETPLLAAARDADLDTIDGFEMLIGQAAFAFELFFGKPAPRAHDDELRTLLTA
ncbi:MAG: shikimate dehydrogenase [Sphingomonadales bacterium]